MWIWILEDNWGGERKRKWGERKRARLSVACLCLMEVPGVALGLLHFTINGGSLWGKTCFSTTPTHSHTCTHPAIHLLVQLNSAASPRARLGIWAVVLRNAGCCWCLFRTWTGSLCGNSTRRHIEEGALWRKMVPRWDELQDDRKGGVTSFFLRTHSWLYLRSDRLHSSSRCGFLCVNTWVKDGKHYKYLGVITTCV